MDGRLALIGLLEAEAGYASLEDGNESDVALATMELAETRESAVMLGVEEKGFYGSVYLFNGDAVEF